MPGRLPWLGPTTSITAGIESSLDPPSAAARERALASALDERYVRLKGAVTSDPVFEGALLEELRHIIVDEGPTHSGALLGLQDALVEGELSPGTPERTICAESVTSGSLSVTAMESLDQINRLLVQRGLLTPFGTA
jgi:hypothetical protein